MKKLGYILLISVVAVILTLMMNTKKGYSDKPVENKMNENIKYETATVAGGCFWCIEAAFEKIPGVVDVISGYSGGHVENPSYQNVTSGTTGHYEAVQITFIPKEVSYTQILNTLFTQIDPTDDSGSFADRGRQYRSAIFYHNDEQKKEAESLIDKINKSKRFDDEVKTKVIALKNFYPAEEYHQDYHKKNPIRYKFYRSRSGRDQFIDKAWAKQDPETNDYKKPLNKDIKSQLSPLQYQVTQEDGTEPAFHNEYWDNKKPGVYVDIVSKEPLFSSTDKFQSGTGWPSFTKPIKENAVVEKRTGFFFTGGKEVRSKKADSHLGHVFSDGPEPTGLRYCINSAALKFIPVKELEKYGLQEYKSLFEF